MKDVNVIKPAQRSNSSLSSNPHTPGAIAMRRSSHRSASSHPAFTIVELLIVIVIIGILAAITVVAYNGITGRARVAALQSAATQAATKIELLKDSNGNYPTTVSSTDLPPPPNITYDYQPVASKGTYCLTATDPATGSYFVTSTGTKSVGPCPVAYFPLDGTAEDKSAYQNNGTNNGATATADRNGKAGGAMGFDGVSSNIDTNQLFNFYKNSSFSSSLWFNTEDNTGRSGAAAGVIGKGHYYDNTWDLRVSNTNSVSFEVSGDATRNGITTATSNPVEVGKWQYITMIYSNGQMKLYVNGENVQTRTYSGIGDFNNTRNLLIGKRSNDSTRVLAGKIDDVRIYDKVLSDKEVKQLYNNAG